MDLLLNWIVPGLLVWAAARFTQRISTEGGRTSDDEPADRAAQHEASGSSWR